MVALTRRRRGWIIFAALIATALVAALLVSRALDEPRVIERTSVDWPARGSLSDDDDVVRSAIDAWAAGSHEIDGEDAGPGERVELRYAGSVSGALVPGVSSDAQASEVDVVIAASGRLQAVAVREDADWEVEVAYDRATFERPLVTPVGLLLPVRMAGEVAALQPTSIESASSTTLDAVELEVDDGLVLGAPTSVFLRTTWSDRPTVFGVGWTDLPVRLTPDGEVDEFWDALRGEHGGEYGWATAALVSEASENAAPQSFEAAVELLPRVGPEDADGISVSAVAVNTGRTRVAAVLGDEERAEVWRIGVADRTGPPLALASVNSEAFGTRVVHAASADLEGIALEAEGRTVTLDPVGLLSGPSALLEPPYVLSAGLDGVAQPPYPLLPPVLLGAVDLG